MKRKLFPLVLIVFILVFSIDSKAGNWFDMETRVCDFEVPTESLLPSSFEKKKTLSGGQYFVVPKYQLSELLNTPGGALYKSEELPNSQIARLKLAIENLKNGPQAAGVALSIADKISDFSGVYGVAAGGLVDWLTTNADAAQKNVDRLSDFITLGGRGGQQMAFRSAPVGFKPLIMINRTYEIQVGREPKPRRWLFSACLLPLQIDFREFETTDPGPNANNKRYIRQDDGSWRRWDNIDGKFENQVLLYVEQDEVFAYFKENSGSTNYRFHMYDGPIQRRNVGDINWGTLYKNNKSK